VYQSSGEPQKALEYYQRSLSIQQPGEYQRFRARTLGDMGLAYVDLGEDVRALDYFNQALALSRKTKDRVGEAVGLYNLALATRGQSDLAASRQYIEECLRIVESLRASVASHKLRASYVASIHRYYDFHTELLMRLHQAHPSEGYAALALEASERARARSLLESLVEGGVDIRRGIDPQLLEREQRLRRTMDAKADRLMRLMSVEAKREEAAILEAEVQDIAVRYDQLQAEVRSKSPRFAALTHPQPLSLEVIQREVLDEETLLLEYALGEERSFLWAVTQETFAPHELPPRADIERMARRLYELMTARQPLPLETVRDHRTRVKEADSQYIEEAARLSEILLGPVAEQLDIKRLLIIGDGALQYLPFGALPVPRAAKSGEKLVPMIAEHEVVSLPSASTLAVLRRETGARESPEKTVAVLADPVFEPDDPRVAGEAPRSDHIIKEALSGTPRSPPRVSDLRRALRDAGFMREGVRSIPRLPATRQEAKAIVAAARAETSFVAVDFRANREMATNSDLGNYRIVHFATHGLLNSEHPELSGIILSMVDEQGQPQNGFLRLPVIYNLELPVDLVVLSACNSALGKEVRGEGLVGMVRGFMYAGAARVVASLWKVDDEATGELMRRFYHGMLKQDLTPADALRQAQIAMWKQKQWQAPFYWAAFVLQGEWM
jgi:CHAT domain-containing protein